MFLDIHLIQNFAPSCLNRDDTNAPKDCLFGGFRRARISSQCLKRAVRNEFRDRKLFPPESLAIRTKRVLEALAERLAKADKDKAQAIEVAKAALAAVELKEAGGDADKASSDERKTEYLLFLGENEVQAIVHLCLQHWDALLAAAAKSSEAAEKPDAKPEKKSKKAKNKADLPKEIVEEMKTLLDGGKAVDLALFGRMLANLSEKNIDAACQVAHAISTHEVSMEMDYYTAVDDLKPKDNQGADMIGVVEFNSSCFYRYVHLSLDKLVENLGDAELAKAGVRAFLDASISAIPTGKQNSMAALNPPLYVRVVVRNEGAPWSLANAFLKPVRAKGSAEADLGKLSVEALERHFDRLAGMYGKEGIQADLKSSFYDEKSSSVPQLLAKLEKELA